MPVWEAVVGAASPHPRRATPQPWPNVYVVVMFRHEGGNDHRAVLLQDRGPDQRRDTVRSRILTRLPNRRNGTAGRSHTTRAGGWLIRVSLATLAAVVVLTSALVAAVDEQHGATAGTETAAGQAGISARATVVLSPTSTPTVPRRPTGATPTTPTTQTTRTAAADPAPDLADTDPITAAAGAQVRAAVAHAVERAAERGITQHVLVADRHTGATITSVQADTAVPAMSIAKLLFAVDLLDSAGGADHVDAATLGRLHTMIATSDDALASAVYQQGGYGQIVERMAARYHLSDTGPSPEPRYWGNVRITAADVASFLAQVLADPRTGPFLSSAMLAATPTARDGFDQEFGMNAVGGAGSKQGWGCCLGGVVAIHSVGFTADEIVVVLSTAAPDAAALNVSGAGVFAEDPGFLASVAAATETARAATDLPVGPLS